MTMMLRRRGVLAASSAAQAPLVVPGTTVPDATNTGALGDIGGYTELNSPTAETYTVAAGANIEGKIIYGDIVHAGTSASRIANCYIRGGSHNPTTGTAVVNVADNRAGGDAAVLTIEDSTIDPQVPAINRDGIRGNRFTARRVRIKGVTDGLVPYAYLSQNNGYVKAYLEHVWVESLRFWNPDYQNGSSGAAYHSDGSHNDSMAINGGRGTASATEATNTGVYAKGLRLNADIIADPSASPPYPTGDAWQADEAYKASGQCILVSYTTTTGDGSALTKPTATSHLLDGVWTEGGKQHIWINPGGSTITLNNYRASRRSAYLDSAEYSTGYWVRYAFGATPDLSGSSWTWWDGPLVGQALAEGANLGIYHNPS